MPSIHDRIGVALELLARQLTPVVTEMIQVGYGPRSDEAIRASLRGLPEHRFENGQWDAQAVLTIMWEHWNEAFRNRMGLFERSLVSELREFRNRWAHQTRLTDDDCFRILDSVERLLRALDQKDAADKISHSKHEALFTYFQDTQREASYSPSNRKRLWFDVALFGICATTIITAVIIVFGQSNLPAALLFCGFVMFTFGYLSYQRLTTVSPVYGIHECPRCRRIIYSDVCPYCEHI